MIGECLCRRVRLEIPARPDYINVCNCKFCRKTGAAWAYFQDDEVAVTGSTASYSRDDIADVWLAGHFCPTCGAATHYTATPNHPSARIGVNTRLFVQDEFDGVEVRFQDGRQLSPRTTNSS